jgi:LCP family protein required for cell wall assembly
MEKAPPNENNWDDAKDARVLASLEQSIVPSEVLSEDQHLAALDTLTDQDETISSDQSVLTVDQSDQPAISTTTNDATAIPHDILSNTITTNDNMTTNENQETSSTETSPPVVDNQETPHAKDSTPVIDNQETPHAEDSTPVIDNQEAISTEDTNTASSTKALTPGQVVTSSKPQARQKKRLPRGIRILLLVLAILVGLGTTAAGLGYYYYTTNIQKPLAQMYRPVKRTNLEATPGVTPTPQPVYDVIKGRSWNILLLGSDNDSKYTFPDVLTQVMMIVHVDTVKNTVTMVSIPRDSWVSIPGGFGMHKIDQAFSLGEQQTGKFDDGVSLARATVEADYGITIDRYAWIGLDGFAKFIDTLGGIDIDVEHPIVDDDYPNDSGNTSNSTDINAYKRLDLAAGPQHLNGQEALEYVRSRHSDLVGDIGRTQRQQQVLEALKLKLNATTIIQNFTQLLKDVSGNIYTDLTEPEMLAFVNYGRTLLNSPIQHLTLGIGSGDQDYGELATIYDPSVGANQDVITPNCINIQPAINRIFQLGDAQSCNVNG